MEHVLAICFSPFSLAMTVGLILTGIRLNINLPHLLRKVMDLLVMQLECYFFIY